MPGMPQPPARLRISRDRKVAPVVSYGTGGRSFRVLPNTFGLPAGPEDSCPGATEVCSAVCYAGRLELAYTSLHRMLTHNLAVLRACGDDVEAMADLLTPVVDEFLEASRRHERRTGRPVARLFRIHWDGDFFSPSYAAAWRTTVLRFPDVHFWTYTRSFTSRLNVLPVLHGLPNLTLYLSVDAANYTDAKRVLREFPDVPISVLAPTAAAGKAMYAALTGRTAAACPEKVGKLPLVTQRGEGACITCGLCVWGRKGVVFPAAHVPRPRDDPHGHVGGAV